MRGLPLGGGGACFNAVCMSLVPRQAVIRGERRSADAEALLPSLPAKRILFFFLSTGCGSVIRTIVTQASLMCPVQCFCWLFPCRFRALVPLPGLVRGCERLRGLR